VTTQAFSSFGVSMVCQRDGRRMRVSCDRKQPKIKGHQGLDGSRSYRDDLGLLDRMAPSPPGS